MAKDIKEIMWEFRDSYKDLIEWFSVWEKRRGRRYYIEVDIKGVDYFTALSIVEDLKARLIQNGMWVRELVPLKSVVVNLRGKSWRFCARVRDFSNPSLRGKGA